MIARLPTLTLVRLWASLLLATIGLQATLPAALSVERTSGSAFSASTYEVALYVQRGERSQRAAVAPQSDVPLPVLAPAEPLPAFGTVTIPTPRPDSTGPPPGDILSWKPAPRAPPRA